MFDRQCSAVSSASACNSQVTKCSFVSLTAGGTSSYHWPLEDKIKYHNILFHAYAKLQ
jgi:hypothetical protein